MGPGQKFLTRIASGRVSHLWFAFVFGKFPLKMSNFSNFFLLGQKKSHLVGSNSTQVKGGPASGLLRAKSMLVLGQAPSLVGMVRALELLSYKRVLMYSWNLL